MAKEQSGNYSLENIKNLSIAERILLVEEIWDSILSSTEEVPLSSEQKKELNSRFEAYKKSPNEIKPWNEIRNNIINKL
ncbi:MAG TPA: addiction module protein [Ignavibacteriales bacterium]|nr:addiction module protein [Ignavibacteriales bacterium]